MSLPSLTTILLLTALLREFSMPASNAMEVARSRDSLPLIVTEECDGSDVVCIIMCAKNLKKSLHRVSVFRKNKHPMIDAISLLSSDEEDNDDDGLEHGIHGSCKRMRLVGSNHPVAITGKQCISALERFEEQQDDSEAQPGYFLSPQDEYNRKIDALHSGFASEIQKREDANCALSHR